MTIAQPASPSSRAKPASRPKSRALRMAVLTILTLFAISSASPAQSAPAASASAAPQLTFDVVSVRRNVSGGRQMTRQSAADTDDITMTNVPLAVIVFYAYFINNESLLLGLPDWAMSERYDVTAKVAPADLPAYHALTGKQRAAMLQSVLADRFQLHAHRETRDRPVYALVVAAGGPKLKEAIPGELHPNTAKANPSGFVHGATIFATGQGQLTGEAAGMADLALALSNSEAEILGRTVVDKTGLTGRYDFILQMDADLSSQDAAARQQDQTAALFTALQQLGLKLQPATAPAEYLVVDHLEKPSEN